MAVYRVELLDKDGHFKPFDLGQYSDVSSEREAIDKAHKRYSAMFKRLSPKTGGTVKFCAVARLIDTQDQPRSGH